MTAYPAQPEVILTAAQMRLMARLVKILSDVQVEAMLDAMELIHINGYGHVTLNWKEGKPSIGETATTWEWR